MWATCRGNRNNDQAWQERENEGKEKVGRRHAQDGEQERQEDDGTRLDDEAGGGRRRSHYEQHGSWWVEQQRRARQGNGAGAPARTHDKAALSARGS